ncbi:hypothetical protein JTB14_005788 [Gonioctena quinquepunctata]|nr:hypothetical protein JTB14_005788 [Gonioctena quinquepunctata]
MALAINKELNCEKKLDGFDNLLRDKNRTYAELRSVELPITDPVTSTARNNITGYPIREFDMVDEDPEDDEMPGDDTIPEYFDSEDSIKDPDFEILDQEEDQLMEHEDEPEEYIISGWEHNVRCEDKIEYTKKVAKRQSTPLLRGLLSTAPLNPEYNSTNGFSSNCAELDDVYFCTQERGTTGTCCGGVWSTTTGYPRSFPPSWSITDHPVDHRHSLIRYKQEAMSADISNDVSRIQDEDVLRKMWQDTEDFGRKKEIRSHMYKLREQRLREFYNSGDVTSEIRTTVETTGKTRKTPTHADSLVDQSFMSLKDKEIRDSESPTRELSYKVTDKHEDHGWQITSSKELSGDGKTRTSKLHATTAGTQKIDGGKIDYAAKNEHINKTHQDGDDKNFTKTVGSQSSSMIKQEAIGGDENSSFRTNSSKTSSSSRVVSEHKSTFQDVPTDGNETSIIVTKNNYTNDVPDELKVHPSYIEGKTKVTKETKTLPDGTVVTTTRYETKGGNSSQISEKYSSNVNNSIENNSSRTSTEVHTSKTCNDRRTQENLQAFKSVRDYDDSLNHQNIKSIDQSTRSETNRVGNDKISYHREKHSTEDRHDVRESLKNSQNLENVSTTQRKQNKLDYYVNQTEIDTTGAHEKVNATSKNKDFIDMTSTRTTKTRQEQEKPSENISHEIISKSHQATDQKVSTDKFINAECNNEEKTRDVDKNQRNRSPSKKPEEPKAPSADPVRKQPRNNEHPKVSQTKVVTESNRTTQSNEDRYETTYKSDYINRKISVEVSPTHDAFARSLRAVSPERIPSRGSHVSSNISLRSGSSPDNIRQPSRYSPERQPRDRSHSPKKATDRFSSNETITYKRTSPDRKPQTKSSPKRSISTDTIGKTTKENIYTRNTSESISVRKKSTNDTTSNKYFDSNTVTRQKPVRSRSPSPSSTIASEIQYIKNVNDIVTDLDDETTNIVSTGERREFKKEKRPTTLEITKKTRKVTERSPTSPLTDLISPNKSPAKEVTRRNSLRSPTKEPSRSPTKEPSRSPTKEPAKFSLPEDRPLKRTDTYEERCRQILGITENTERRRSSLEISTHKRNSLTRSDITSTNKINRSPDKSPVKSPVRLGEDVLKSSLDSTRMYSPGKQNREKSPEKKPIASTGKPIGKTPEGLKTIEKKNQENYTSDNKNSMIESSETVSTTKQERNKQSIINKPSKHSPNKESPTNETTNKTGFTSQITRTEYETLSKSYHNKEGPRTNEPRFTEYQSQIDTYPARESSCPSHMTESPLKEPSRAYPEKDNPTKKESGVTGYLSQNKISSVKEPLESYTENGELKEEISKITEFSSQKTQSVNNSENHLVHQAHDVYPDQDIPKEATPKMSKYKPQVKKYSVKEPLESYPEKEKLKEKPPKITEFPSQKKQSTSNTSEKYLVQEIHNVHPDKDIPKKATPKITEFPSQIKKSPVRESLESYPEKEKLKEKPPKITEFPSQKKQPSSNNPEKYPVEEPHNVYPDGDIPKKATSKITEFPSQIRKSPVKEPLESYPEKEKLKEKEPLALYPKKERPKENPLEIIEFPSQNKQRRPENSEFIRQKNTQTNVVQKIEQALITGEDVEIDSSTEDVSEDEVLDKTTEKHTDINMEQKYQTTEKPHLDSKPTKKYTKIEVLQRTPLTPRRSSSKHDEIENIFNEEKNYYVENKIPIKEPLITKTFISQLCREGEIERNDVSQKVVSGLSKDIVKGNQIPSTPTQLNRTPNKSEKPMGKKLSAKSFIEKECNTSMGTNDTEKRTQVKSSPNDKSTIKKPNESIPSTRKVNIKIDKFNGLDSEKSTTEYTDKCCKAKIKEIPKIHSKPIEKTTPIDARSKIEKDHIKIKKMNNTITTKTTPLKTELKENVGNKPKPKEQPSQPSGTTKKSTVIMQSSINKKPVLQKSAIKQPESSTPQYTTIRKKTINPTDQTMKPKTFSSTPKKPTNDNKKTTISLHAKKPHVPEEAMTKRNLVTTTITLKALGHPKGATKSNIKQGTVTKTKTTIKSKPSARTPEKTKIGKNLSDTEDEYCAVDSLEGSIIDISKDDDISESEYNITKMKPDMNKMGRKHEKKCITTKTVIINNNETDRRDIIVDVQRSISSREPTPDRLCPVPLSSDEEPLEIPRYPDAVVEPDDNTLRRKPKRLSDIPIIESEDTREFSRFTDVTDIDRVDETDDSLLSVNRKISKFSDTKNIQGFEKLGPAPKVERPKLNVTEDLESDDCLLSVSDKVTKFISTAEDLITHDKQTEIRPKSPKCKNYTEDRNEPENKKTYLITGTTEVNDDDECLLSVTEKVSKFISTADKLTSHNKSPVSLARIEIKPKQETDKKSPERKLPTNFVPTDSEDETYIRKVVATSSDRKTATEQIKNIEIEGYFSSYKVTLGRKLPTEDGGIEERKKLPSRHSPTKTKSTESDVEDHSPTRQSIREGSSPSRSPRRKDSSSTLSPTRKNSFPTRLSQEEPKPVLSSTGRMRSTESIRKAKALFENMSSKEPISKKIDVANKSTILHRSRTEYNKMMARRRLGYDDDEDDRPSKTKTISNKTSSRSSSPEKDVSRSNSPEKSINRESSPDNGDVPRYMMPLDRSLEPHSPRKGSSSPTKSGSIQPITPLEHKESKTTKYGVSLRGTDSTTSSTTTTSPERKKSSVSSEKPITEEDIEEIYELVVLEELLEEVIRYELRKKIRAQIRLVKKLISENNLMIYIARRKSKTGNTKRESSPGKTKHPVGSDSGKTSPEKKHAPKRLPETDVGKKDTEKEYHSSYSHSDRRTSSGYTKVHRNKSPDSEVPETEVIEKKSYSYNERRSSSDYMKKVHRTKSPETKPQKSEPQKSADDKPEWVKQRNLRKVTETTPLTITVTKTTKKEKITATPVTEIKPTDLITSSYGVGPTDENGTPLFGLRALRAQNKTDTTKVQGTVIRSEFYSKNGNEPIGEVSVTKYSTDPRDLGKDDESADNNGITRITTTQKFGYKDTPSLKSITNKNKEITSEDSQSNEIKVTRRNSVKALSQKFIDNAVETLKSERQTSYPRAGLILRTSSFKDADSESDHEETSSTFAESECSTRIQTSTTRSVTGETFLTNKTRVTGVKDVINRMKTEECQDGDSEEDVKARGLLNKFIGSQVILSGMESREGSMKTSGSAKKTIKVTTTITVSS